MPTAPPPAEHVARVEIRPAALLGSGAPAPMEWEARAIAVSGTVVETWRASTMNGAINGAVLRYPGARIVTNSLRAW